MSPGTLDRYPWIVAVGFLITVAAIFVWAWVDARDERAHEVQDRQRRALERRPMRGGLR